MTKARYLFRMDDITPTMDWDRFWALLKLFERYRVKPLLGIVPDNHDRSLDIMKPHPKFWETMNTLVERDLVDIAQHGYQHILERANGEGSRDRNGKSPPKRSEFAGYSYQEQLEKILKGKEILKANGLATDSFFAPNHSFDLTTLCALKTAGFAAVSDGHTLKPHRHRDLVFIPQQLWRPMWMPLGVFTICLHSNEITTGEVKAIRQFLRTPASLSSFSREVRSFKRDLGDTLLNGIFSCAYATARAARRGPQIRRQRPSEGTMARPARSGTIRDGEDCFAFKPGLETGRFAANWQRADF